MSDVGRRENWSYDIWFFLNRGWSSLTTERRNLPKSTLLV